MLSFNLDLKLGVAGVTIVELSRGSSNALLGASR